MDDDLEETVSEIEQDSTRRIDDENAERRPWHYMGWSVFADDTGKPIALRPEEIVAVRPGNYGRCGLTIRGRDKTVIVCGDFLDVLDATVLP